MRVTLDDGRTLCCLPDKLHESLWRGIMRQGFPCPDHLAICHGPFLFDPTTAYKLVYHVRGDIYCADRDGLYVLHLLTKPHNQTKQHAN